MKDAASVDLSPMTTNARISSHRSPSIQHGPLFCCCKNEGGKMRFFPLVVFHLEMPNLNILITPMNGVVRRVARKRLSPSRHESLGKCERNYHMVWVFISARSNYTDGHGAMTIKCDYCRGSLGPNVRRYWRMRFCSAECVAAYQPRLDKGTAKKIYCLDTQVDSGVRVTRQGRGQREAA
jgi:hypothetical protein